MEFFYLVRLDSEVQAGEPVEFVRDRLQAKLSRAAFDIAGEGFSVNWSSGLAATIGSVGRVPECPRVSDWPGGYCPKPPKSARGWLMRIRDFAETRPLQVVVLSFLAGYCGWWVAMLLKP